MQDATPPKPTDTAPSPNPAIRPSAMRYVHRLTTICSIGWRSSTRYRRIAVAVFIADAGRDHDSGLLADADVPGAGAAAHRRRAIHGDAGHQNVENTYWQDPEPYYKTQYRILQRPRSDAPGRQAARPGDGPRVQRHGSATGDAGPVDLARLLARRALEFVRPAPPVAPVSRGAASPTRRPTSRPSSARSSAASQVVPVPGSRLVDVTFTSADPKFAADGGQRAGRRVRRPEPRGEAAEHAEHARLAREGASASSSRRSRTASGRSPTTATARTRCRSTTSRTSSSRG